MYTRAVQWRAIGRCPPELLLLPLVPTGVWVVDAPLWNSARDQWGERGRIQEKGGCVRVWVSLCVFRWAAVMGEARKLAGFWLVFRFLWTECFHFRYILLALICCWFGVHLLVFEFLFYLYSLCKQTRACTVRYEVRENVMYAAYKCI